MATVDDGRFWIELRLAVCSGKEDGAGGLGYVYICAMIYSFCISITLIKLRSTTGDYAPLYGSAYGAIYWESGPSCSPTSADVAIICSVEVVPAAWLTPFEWIT